MKAKGKQENMDLALLQVGSDTLQNTIVMDAFGSYARHHLGSGKNGQRCKEFRMLQQSIYVFGYVAAPIVGGDGVSTCRSFETRCCRQKSTDFVSKSADYLKSLSPVTRSYRESCCRCSLPCSRLISPPTFRWTSNNRFQARWEEFLQRSVRSTSPPTFCMHDFDLAAMLEL